MAEVDIIIPLYNKADTIARTIRSVQHQTVKDWRLIIVNDGSTDNGPDIVAGIDDARIEIIHQENKGPGAARNAALSRATAPYTSFIDADDEWYPWFLENCLAAIKQNDVALVAATYYRWPEGIDETPIWEKKGIKPGTYSITGTEDVHWVTIYRGFFKVWHTLLKTEVAKKYDGFYEKNKCLSGEDTTFFLRILFNETALIITPPAVRHHIEHSELGAYIDIVRPVAPFVTEPEAVLNYCPQEKKKLLESLLDLFAVNDARRMARAGKKRTAVELLKKFPNTCSYAARYRRCRFEIALSPVFPYWVRFKTTFSGPLKAFFRNLMQKFNRSQPPKMPYE